MWPSPDGDRCKNMSCVRGPTGELSIQEAVETCYTDCPLVSYSVVNHFEVRLFVEKMN